MKQTGKGNVWTQRREAEMSMKKHYERMATVEVSRDIANWKKPVPMKLISRMGGKAVLRQKKIDAENKQLVKLIYETMNEDRRKGSYEYAPGYRVTKAGKAIIDCYPTELGSEFHDLHSGEAIKKREEQRMKKHTEEFFRRVAKADSPYGRATMEKEWQKNRRLKTAMNSTRLMPWSMYLLKATNPNVPQTFKEVIKWQKEEKMRKRHINMSTQNQNSVRPGSAPALRGTTGGHGKYRRKWSDIQHPDWDPNPNFCYNKVVNLAQSEREAQIKSRVTRMREEVELGTHLENGFDISRYFEVPFSADAAAHQYIQSRSPSQDHVNSRSSSPNKPWDNRMTSSPTDINLRWLKAASSRPLPRTDKNGEKSPYRRELELRGVDLNDVYDAVPERLRALAKENKDKGRRPNSASAIMNSVPGQPKQKQELKPSIQVSTFSLQSIEPIRRRVLLLECAMLALSSETERKLPVSVSLHDVGFILPQHALLPEHHIRSTVASTEVNATSTVPYALSHGIEISIRPTATYGSLHPTFEGESAFLSMRDLIRLAGQRQSGDEKLYNVLNKRKLLHRKAQLYESLADLRAIEEETLCSLVLRSFRPSLSEELNKVSIEFTL